MAITRVNGQDIKDGAIVNADVATGAAIDATKIADGSVSNAEFQRLDGVTSGIQSQFNATILTGPTADLRNLITPTGEFTALTIHDNWISTATPYNVFAVKNTGGSNSLLSVTNVSGAYTIRVHIATPVRFYDADSSNYAGIKAAGVTSADYTLTLPASAPIANGYLVTDGSGNLSWIVGTPATRTISTTAPLSGGGDLSANRTLTTSMATNRLIGRTTAGTGVMQEITVSTGLSFASQALSLSVPVSIANGGTNATTSQNARNNLLPTQAGNATKVLQTDGTDVSWQAVGTPATPDRSVQFANSGAFGADGRFTVDTTSEITVSLGESTPAGGALLELKPDSLSGSIPLYMKMVGPKSGQAFFRVEGVISADTLNNLSTDTDWTEEEMIRISVNGVDRWIRAYSKAITP